MRQSLELKPSGHLMSVRNVLGFCTSEWPPDQLIHAAVSTLGPGPPPAAGTDATLSHALKRGDEAKTGNFIYNFFQSTYYYFDD